MIPDQRGNKVEKALGEWRATLPPIADAEWEPLANWIMTLRTHARDRKVVAYFKCIIRPPSENALYRKAYRKAAGIFILWALKNGYLHWPWERTSSDSNLISAAPGSKLLSLVTFLYSPHTVEYTFKPIIADWCTQYFDALRLEKHWKARLIYCCYIYRFIAAMMLSTLLFIIRYFISGLE